MLFIQSRQETVQVKEYGLGIYLQHDVDESGIHDMIFNSLSGSHKGSSVSDFPWMVSPLGTSELREVTLTDKALRSVINPQHSEANLSRSEIPEVSTR